MESEEAMMPPPGKSRYARIEEKIIHLTRSNVEKQTKEILEILDEGEILHPTQGPSIVKRLIGKTDDLYMEPCFPELVKTLHSSYKESALAIEEDLKDMVWEQLRYGTPNISDQKRSNRITTKSTAVDAIAKLKIFTPLDAELNTRIMWNYSYYCKKKEEWNSYFMDMLTFLVREGGDPFYPLGQENGQSLTTTFTLFLGRLSTYVSDSMMPSVSIFLEEAFKKWEASISKENILNDVIKNLPSDIVKGESSRHSSIKGLIVGNCLKIIETHPSLCDNIDGDRKTPLHRLMERILHDGRWQQISELVTGNEVLWDLMSGMTTNKNVNFKDRDKVTPYTWILWWQKHVTDLQTLNALEKQTLERKIEDIKKHFQGKGASEEDAREGMKNLKTKSQNKRIEEKIECLTTFNIELETKEILEILKEGEIMYPTKGPSIMMKLVGKTDDLYMEPSFAQLVKTLHCSYEASALAREEDLTEMVWGQIRWGATDKPKRNEKIYISAETIAAEVIAKLKIYTPLEAMLCTRIFNTYIDLCDIKREWNSHFVDLLTFLIREGADPFYPLGTAGKPPFETAFQGFLRRFSSHLAESLMPSVSTFMEEAFIKLTDSMSEENALNIVIRSIPSNVIEGGDTSCSSMKKLIVENCLKMIETSAAFCDHLDGEGKTPLHRLLERILLDGLWQQISELVAGTDVLWDLMSAMITNKNVNIKGRDKVTPYTRILWWQKSATDLHTLDALEKQKLEKKIEDIKKHFQGQGASEEDALQGMRNLTTKSQYMRIEEKIECLTTSNIEQQTKEILEIAEEGEIIYPTKGPSIMKKLVGKTDDLYMEPSFAQLVKTLHCSYEASALAREEDLTNLVWYQLRYGATDWSERKEVICITKSIAAEVIAKLKIYTPLEAMLCTRILGYYVYYCDIKKEWNSHFVDLLTFLIKEGADPLQPMRFYGKPLFETAFQVFLRRFSSHLAESLMPSVSTFMGEAFRKLTDSMSEENTLNIVIRSIPSNIIEGGDRSCSSMKKLIVENCLNMIETHPSLCDHLDGEGKTPFLRLMERILLDGLWQQISELIAGSDVLWDLMFAMITNKNVNVKDRDKVTPFTWILWWQKYVTDLQTLDALEKQKLERKIEDITKSLQEKGASKEDALQGMKNLKTTSNTTDCKTSDFDPASQSHQKSNVESEPPLKSQKGSTGGSEPASQTQQKSKVDSKQPSETQQKSAGDSELSSQSQQKSKIESKQPSETQQKSTGESELPLQSRQEMTGEPASPREENSKTSLQEQVTNNPQVSKKSPRPKVPSRKQGVTIPSYIRQSDFKCIEIVKTIGSGAFGSISLCKKGERVFVLKEMLRGNNPEEQRLFLKEAFLLQTMKHQNIVKFESIVKREDGNRFTLGLLLEYVVFDFCVLGDDGNQISSLAELIEILDGENFTGYEHFNKFIASDVAQGLAYLHNDSIVHRDLKPANILVSNQHYNELGNACYDKYWRSRPIVAKLTDFGAGRAELIQTATMGNFNIARGTPVFSAPEIICEHLQRPSLEDWKHADVWSFGMLLYVLINPDLKHPYEAEIKAGQAGHGITLQRLMAKKQLPSHSEKYVDQRKSEWSNILEAFNLCAKFTDRPSIDELADILEVIDEKRIDSDPEPPSTGDDECNQHISINLQPSPAGLVTTVLNNGENYYKMSAKPRGRVIILNNETFDQSENAEAKLEGRAGSYFDVANSRKLFEALHFEVVVWSNISASEIRERIAQECQSDFHEKADAFIFIILSHGKKSHIFGSDGRLVHINNEIVSAFDGRRCPKLIGKPKLFFIQACQGDEVSKGAMKQDTATPQRQLSSSTPTDEGPLHEKADILTFYSTVPDYASWRHTKLGSWFIRDVVICINNFAHERHVGDIMTEVIKQVSQREVESEGYKQMPEGRTTLKKYLYFLPSP